jgi:hypothetical protein
MSSAMAGSRPSRVAKSILMCTRGSSSSSRLSRRCGHSIEFTKRLQACTVYRACTVHIIHAGPGSRGRVVARFGIHSLPRRGTGRWSARMRDPAATVSAPGTISRSCASDRVARFRRLQQRPHRSKITHRPSRCCPCAIALERPVPPILGTRCVLKP